MIDLTLEQWSQIGIALGMAFSTVASLALTLWAGKHLIIQLRGLWAAIRGREKAILAQVDQPTDLLPKYVEKLTGIPAPVVSAVLTAVAKTVLANLDIPVQEVNVGGTAK